MVTGMPSWELIICLMVVMYFGSWATVLTRIHRRNLRTQEQVRMLFELESKEAQRKLLEAAEKAGFRRMVYETDADVIERWMASRVAKQ